MKKLFSNLKKMWKSLQRIFGSLTGKLTQGTGVVVKTGGNVIARGIAGVALIGLVLLIVIIAIPYGAFAAKDKPKGDTVETEQQVKQNIPVYKCNTCNEEKSIVFKDNKNDKHWVCYECLRKAKKTNVH